MEGQRSGRRPIRYDLLIFDLDGTLTDPIEGISRSINYALSGCGFDTAEPARMAEHIGPPLDDVFRALAGVLDVQRMADLVARYRERYADVGYRETVVYPGIAEVLADLTAAGQRMAVCTSKRPDFAVRILKMFDLLDYFAFVDGGDVGITKAQQLSGLKSGGRLGARALMIGDRGVDISAARENGLPGAGVLWGFRSLEELGREAPLHLFGRPSEWLGLAGDAAVIADVAWPRRHM